MVSASLHLYNNKDTDKHRFSCSNSDNVKLCKDSGQGNFPSKQSSLVTLSASKLNVPEKLEDCSPVWKLSHISILWGRPPMVELCVLC